MGRYPKGIEARQNIIQQAVGIYNEEGLGITLEQLARRLNISRGSITNYFPTKDNLFIAIAEEYEITLNDLLQNYDWGEGPITLRKMARYFGAILDNQYQYRSAITFSMTAGPQQREMIQHVVGTYPNRKEQIKQRIELLIDAGIVEPRILEPANLMVFLFQYTTVMSTWMFSMGLLSSTAGYTATKPLVLHAALACYLPYLTYQGNKEYDELKAADLKDITSAYPGA